MESDTIDSSKRITIHGGYTAMMGNMFVEDFHLSTTNACTDITHTIIVAHSFVMIVRISLSSLSSIPHDTIAGFAIRTDQRTSTRRGNDLVAIERQDTVTTKSTDDTPFELRAESLGSVLNYRNAITVGYGHDLVNSGRHTIEINRYNGLRLTSRQGYSVLNSMFKKLRIHIPRLAFGVDHYRRCPQVLDGMCRGTEREALNQHIVARTYATSQQSQMDGSRA